MPHGALACAAPSRPETSRRVLNPDTRHGHPLLGLPRAPQWGLGPLRRRSLETQIRRLLEATALSGFGPGSSRARWTRGVRELCASIWGIRIKSWAGRLARLSFPPPGLCPPAPAAALLSPVWTGLRDGPVPGHARESWTNTASKRGLTSGKLPQPHGRPAEGGASTLGAWVSPGAEGRWLLAPTCLRRVRDPA